MIIPDAVRSAKMWVFHGIQNCDDLLRELGDTSRALAGINFGDVVSEYSSRRRSSS